jgi:starvation-inducible DNA-binding protein
MYPTKNDLPPNQRAALQEILNRRLADLIDLHAQTKQAHWNVKGPNFIALHEMFDSFADDLSEHADDVAERVTALGGIAEGRLPFVVDRSSLEPYPATPVTGRDHLLALVSAYAAAAKSIRIAIGEAEECDDAGTADLFTGVSRSIDKKLGFLESHLQADA